MTNKGCLLHHEILDTKLINNFKGMKGLIKNQSNIYIEVVLVIAWFRVQLTINLTCGKILN